MEKVVEFKHSKSIEERKHNSSLAMVVALISFAMLFLTLMMGFLVYRMNNQVWPPMGFEQIPLIIPTISTLVILLSSVSYYFMEKSYESGEMVKSKRFYYLTLFLGFGFLVSQVFLWKQLDMWGLYVESGIFASILHGFTWIHAGHVVLGILGLFFLAPVMRKLQAYPNHEVRVGNIGKFWHFLGVVWFIMFIVLFVL